MKLGILFSGGKDSTYAAFLAKKYKNEIACLITLKSKNRDSYMFHTPSIDLTEIQAKEMNISLIEVKTKGEKEEELKDLERAIKLATEKHKIEGIVTGAVESIYQSTRIQKICNKLDIGCFNPLWQRNQIDLLNELIKNNFKIIITGVAAYPFDEKYIGRKIDKKLIEELKKLQEKYKINPAGEGGEFETAVIKCPLFKRELNLKLKKIEGLENNFRGIFE